ncbi:unnamed protein product [Leuciscus chuanchicus]
MVPKILIQGVQVQQFTSQQQLWVAGLLVAPQQLPEEVEMSDWGIDWDGPVPVEDPRQQTDIPMTQSALREMLEAQLQDSIDPFKTSDFLVWIFTRRHRWWLEVF